MVDTIEHDLVAQTDGEPDFVSAEVRLALVNALMELPEAEQQVIQLCILGGLSHTEASSTIGVPLGTVKSRIKRGLESLRQRFANQPRWYDALFTLPAFPRSGVELELRFESWDAYAKHQSQAGPSPIAASARMTHPMFVTGLAVILLLLWMAIHELVIDPEPHSEGSSATALPETADNPSLDVDEPRTGSVNSESPSPGQPSNLEGSAGAGEKTAREGMPDAAPDAPPSLPADVPSPGDTRLKSEYYLPESGEPKEVKLTVTLTYTEAGWILEGPYTEYYRGGAVKEQGSLRRGMRHGPWILRYRLLDPAEETLGPVEYEGSYADNEMDGPWRKFWPSGRDRWHGVYQKGSRTGLWEFFWDDDAGTLKAQVPFSNVGAHGRAVFYDELGQLARECDFDNDDKHGIEIIYDAENGRCRRSTEYRKNRRHGTETLFDKRTGEVNAVLFFQDGHCRYAYRRDALTGTMVPVPAPNSEG